jgi:hypothetical protein
MQNTLLVGDVYSHPSMEEAAQHRRQSFLRVLGLR